MVSISNEIPQPSPLWPACPQKPKLSSFNLKRDTTTLSTDTMFKRLVRRYPVSISNEIPQPSPLRSDVLPEQENTCFNLKRDTTTLSTCSDLISWLRH